MPVHNKLVRDRILEIIQADNLKYNSKILNDEELLIEIKRKMVEEAEEFKETKSNKDAIEELSDILELVHAAVKSLNSSYEELEAVRLKKKEKRGGFDKAIYLIDVEDK